MTLVKKGNALIYYFLVVVLFLLINCFPFCDARGTNFKINPSLRKRGIQQAESNLTACWEACEESDWIDELPVEVKVGAYLIQITNVDTEAATFYAVGYIWMVYKTCQRIDGEPIEPYVSITLENAVTEFEVEASIPYETSLCELSGDGFDLMCPVCDTPVPGYSYLAWKFRGEFNSPFNYLRYPVDSQELYISFEDLSYDARSIKLVADTRDSNIHKSLDISGFYPVEPIARCYEAGQWTYYGDAEGFGVSSAEAEQESKDVPKSFYSHCEIGIKIKRNLVFFVMRVLPPALITLAVSTGILFLDPMRLDARLATATTGLLTEVFLQLGFSDKIPDVGVLTVADWVFNWCFFLLLIIIGDCILVHTWLRSIEKMITEYSIGLELHTFKEAYDPSINIDELKAEAKIAVDKKLRRAKWLDRLVVKVIVGMGSIGTILVIILAVYA